jgi:hypothetical protein
VSVRLCIKVPPPVRERSFVHKGSRRLEYLTALQLLHYSAKRPHVRQSTFVCASGTHRRSKGRKLLAERKAGDHTVKQCKTVAGLIIDALLTSMAPTWETVWHGVQAYDVSRNGRSPFVRSTDSDGGSSGVTTSAPVFSAHVL